MLEGMPSPAHTVVRAAETLQPLQPLQGAAVGQPVGGVCAAAAGAHSECVEAPAGGDAHSQAMQAPAAMQEPEAAARERTAGGLLKVDCGQGTSNEAGVRG